MLPAGPGRLFLRPQEDVRAMQLLVTYWQIPNLFQEALMRNMIRGIGRSGSAILILTGAMAVSAAAVEVKVPVPQVHITVQHPPVHTPTPQLHTVTPTLKGNALNSSKGLQQDNSSKTPTGGRMTFEESKRKTGGGRITITKENDKTTPTLFPVVEEGPVNLEGARSLNTPRPNNPSSGGTTPNVGGINVTKVTGQTSPTLLQKAE